MNEEEMEVKKKMIGRVEQAVRWLCVPEGEVRGSLLTDYDRLLLLRMIMAQIATMDLKVQAELGVHWLNELTNTHRKKDFAAALLTRMAKVLYASPAMEKWAEGRLLNTELKITPRDMAREYSINVHGDERMVGAYVRDMQRIKHRLKQRKASRKTAARQPGYEVTVPRPRYKRTKRQSDKYEEVKAALAKRKQDEKKEMDALLRPV